MAVPYPSNPTDGMLFTYRGQTYSYSEAGGWEEYANDQNPVVTIDEQNQTVSVDGSISATSFTGNFTLADNSVTNAILRDSTGLSVIGRSANSTGDPADIAAASDGQVLRRASNTLAFGQIATAGIASDAVDNTKIRDSAALSVIGRSANSTGDPADIAAGTDGYVLRRSGATLGFGQIAAAGISDGAVTGAKLNADVADSYVHRTNGTVSTASTSSSVVRNITFSTSPPTGGNDGDVWMVYS